MYVIVVLLSLLDKKRHYFSLNVMRAQRSQHRDGGRWYTASLSLCQSYPPRKGLFCEDFSPFVAASPARVQLGSHREVGRTAWGEKK